MRQKLSINGPLCIIFVHLWQFWRQTWFFDFFGPVFGPTVRQNRDFLTISVHTVGPKLIFRLFSNVSPAQWDQNSIFGPTVPEIQNFLTIFWPTVRYIWAGLGQRSNLRPHSKDLPWNAAVCLPFLFTKVCLHWKCKHRMQLVICFSLTPHIRHWVWNWQSCEHLKTGVQACGQPVTGAVFAPKRPLSHDGKALQPCIHKLPLVGFTGGRLFFCIVPWTHIHPQDLVSL